jgi:branched-chain amino acid transport system substrate-binding protein
MWSPFSRLKFAFNADNQQQVDAGVTSMIGKGKKDFCIEYQDTDYGKDILAGLQDALKENNLPLVAKETPQACRHRSRHADPQSAQREM